MGSTSSTRPSSSSTRLCLHVVMQGGRCAHSFSLGGESTRPFLALVFRDDFRFPPQKIISRVSPLVCRASSLVFTELDFLCARTPQWYIKAIQSQAFNLFKQYKFQDAIKVGAGRQSKERETDGQKDMQTRWPDRNPWTSTLVADSREIAVFGAQKPGP